MAVNVVAVAGSYHGWVEMFIKPQRCYPNFSVFNWSGDFHALPSWLNRAEDWFSNMAASFEQMDANQAFLATVKLRVIWGLSGVNGSIDPLCTTWRVCWKCAVFVVLLVLPSSEKESKLQPFNHQDGVVSREEFMFGMMDCRFFRDWQFRDTKNRKVTLRKFHSSPLKSYRYPIGK